MPTVFSTPLGTIEFQYRGIVIRVKVGVDMTTLDAGAYCNSTNSYLDLTKGALAKRLRIVGGPKFEEACRTTKTTDGVAVTAPGNLNCKHVIHLDIHHPGSWEDKILKVLNKADSKGTKKIIMPIFGTGAGGVDPNVVSTAMFEAIDQYVKGDAPTIKEIICVVYENSMAESFQMATIEELPKNSEEYQRVRRSIEQNENVHVENVYRISNILLSGRYYYTKKAMEMKKPNAPFPLEADLWHGTSREAAQQISNAGFKHDVPVENARVYGDGTYFAGNPSTSLQYVTGGTNGMLILSKVLTGCCFDVVPNKRSTTPPPTGYDSVRVANRKVYVVFDDSQSLPEYLVTLAKPQAA